MDPKGPSGKKARLNWDQFTDSQLTNSWATGIFPYIHICLYPETCFFIRALFLPTDPEKLYYDTMILFRLHRTRTIRQSFG